MEIWFGIANGQILSICDRVIYLRHDNGGILLFHIFILFIFFFFEKYEKYLYGQPPYLLHNRDN